MARDFNGTTDRIDYSNVIDWGGQAQTISCWVNNDAAATPSQYFCTDHQSGDAALGAVIFWITDDGSDAAITALHATLNVTRTGAVDNLSNGTWQHILATWDGSTSFSNIHIYVGGAEVATYTDEQNGSGGATAGDGSMSIGGRITDDNRNWNGQLAEFGRWNRVLSAAEISLLASKHAPSFISSGIQIYIPYTGNDTFDKINGAASNVDGTSSTTHVPGMIYPHGKIPLRLANRMKAGTQFGE